VERLVRGSDRRGTSHQPSGRGQVDLRLVDDHLCLAVRRQIPHRQSHEPLPERWFEFLERAAVGRVVGAHEHECLWCFYDFAGTVQVERSAVIGQGVEDGQRIVPGFHDLVEIADRAGLHRSGEGSIGPHHVATGHHEPTDEVRARQIVVAADGDDRALQEQTHVLDQAGLPTTGRAGQHHGQTPMVGALEHLHFVAVGGVNVDGRTFL
jgi:hypothetical protein